MSRGGFSSERLRCLHDRMERYVERGEIPGIVTLVSRRGETYVDTIGALSFGGPTIQRDSIFRITSMTKPVVAVAAMILVEECQLRLDDPVDGWLPELADRRVLRRPDGPLDDTVPAQRPITVRDLLTFRMGFGQLFAPPDAYPILQAATDLEIGMGPPAPGAMPPPDEWLRRLGSLPLIYQPGEHWAYNTASELLGVLIARVSGQPLEDFLRERIFQPLGMKDTGFYVRPEQLDRFVTCYATDLQTGALAVYDAAEDGQWSRPPAFPSGGGGLVSTVDDYAAFAQMLLSMGRYGRQRMLSRPSVELMTVDHLSPGQRAEASTFLGTNRGWGFGMAVVTERDQIWAMPGRYGWDGGFGTSWANDPSEELVAILLTQRLWDSPDPPSVYLDFWTSVYQAIDD